MQPIAALLRHWSAQQWPLPLPSPLYKKNLNSDWDKMIFFRCFPIKVIIPCPKNLSPALSTCLAASRASLGWVTKLLFKALYTCMILGDCVSFMSLLIVSHPYLPHSGVPSITLLEFGSVS